MGDGEPKQSVEDLEAEVWNAIAAFEQILEAMPTDRVSLETLSDAYEKVGDHTRAKDYLVRLVNVLADEGDGDAASAQLEKLRKYEGEDPDVAKAIERVEQLAPAPKEGKAAARSSATQHVAVNITGELSFAWNLLQARELTQEEYSRVVQELSDASTGSQMVTVSVLHVLHEHDMPTLPRILAYASKESSTPLVSVTSFDLQADTVRLLEIEFMIRRGAIVFETMGKDALVACMNPYDQQLRKDVEAILNRKCHFYLTPPEDFDNAIEKIKELLAPPKA
ncbi:MAG: hypothetical protein JXR37_18815 [Kiritimatiellae bacterium]|nr:hypothetical protein [Kiritimatiellia bacterium]